MACLDLPCGLPKRLATTTLHQCFILQMNFAMKAWKELMEQKKKTILLIALCLSARRIRIGNGIKTLLHIIKSKAGKEKGDRVGWEQKHVVSTSPTHYTCWFADLLPHEPYLTYPCQQLSNSRQMRTVILVHFLVAPSLSDVGRKTKAQFVKCSGTFG